MYFKTKHYNNRSNFILFFIIDQIIIKISTEYHNHNIININRYSNMY